MADVALVTGAHGFIGRHVCQALAAHGVTVEALGHGAWSPLEAAKWGISRWLEADITIESLNQVTNGGAVDAIIHCAGSGSVAYSYTAPFQDYQRSVTTVATVLEFVRSIAVNRPRIVITSSAAVYGDHGDVDLAESSDCAPVSPYGFHKRAAEDICRSYSRFFGLNISIVRLFSVYGEGLRKQLLWDAVNKLTYGTPQFFGTGTELRDWIHVVDAADLLCAAAFQSRRQLEVFNGSHEQVTTSHILGLLNALLGTQIPPVFSGEVHTGNPKRLTADTSYVRSELQWRPNISLAEGLCRYVKWINIVKTIKP